ncbi:MAG: hypothetical protein WC635_12955 [Bacteriovorax sp.]
MKIFSPHESAAKSTARKTSRTSEGPKRAGKKMKEAAIEKAPIGEKEIREKLAAHVETSNTAKSQLIKKNNSQALGSGFMNGEVKPKIVAEAPVDSVKESHLLMSDVQLNDPTDTNTQEKLKSVLRNGAFSFNPKEKDTLEKILAGS